MPSIIKGLSCKPILNQSKNTNYKLLKTIALGVPVIWYLVPKKKEIKAKSNKPQMNQNQTNDESKFRQFLATFLLDEKHKNVTEEQWMHYQDYSIYNLRR